MLEAKYKGRCYGITPTLYGTANHGGTISLAGCLLSSWIAIGSGHTTLEAALEAAHQRAEALNLNEYI